jgi:chemotaxis family two-component system response regulator Rcp1
MTPIRMLLVEDNPGDADLTRDTLESGKLQLQIDVVVDGEAAVDYLLRRGRYATAERPDLIFLDLNLPRLSGVQVLSEIKRHDELCHIPVVVLSSSDAEKDIAQSYRLGASSYMKKPIELAAFMATVSTFEHFWFTVVKV